MSRILLLLVGLASAAPLAARPLTVRSGETWLFAVREGAAVNARKALASAPLAPGQFKVTLQPLIGATMTITNNSRFDYSYRASLTLPDGKQGATKSCAVPANGRLAIEHWPQRVAAVTLDRFRPAPAGSLCP